jgi:hypothetical protein
VLSLVARSTECCSLSFDTHETLTREDLLPLWEWMCDAHCPLTALDLSGFGKDGDCLGSLGAASLAKVLRRNRSLQRLDLAGAGLFSPSLLLLFEAIEANPHTALQSLVLYRPKSIGNQCGPRAMAALARMLQSNTTITELTVDGYLFFFSARYNDCKSLHSSDCASFFFLAELFST